MPNLVGRRCKHADGWFGRMNALARPKPTLRSDEPGQVVAEAKDFADAPGTHVQWAPVPICAQG